MRTITPRSLHARLKVTAALSIAVGVPLLLFLGYLALPIFWRGNQDLYEAIERGDLAGVERLLQRGADANSRWRGFQFLRLGAHDRRREFAEPPLILAIHLRQPVIAVALIQAGADVNSRDAHGRSALELARQQGQMDVARLLREKHARE